MKSIIKKWAAPLMCGLFVFLLFNYVFFIGYVPTESMEPAIKSESFIFGCRITGDIHRGYIIAFKHDGNILIKRVAAISGDIIYSDNTGKVISVNEELSEMKQILTVPDDCYFVLGDNAEHSIDSRFWEEGFIKEIHIIAKIFN